MLVQSQVELYKYSKKYLILLLNTQHYKRYRSRVSRAIQEKEVVPTPKLQFSSYWKESFWVGQLTYISARVEHYFIYVWLFIFNTDNFEDLQVFFMYHFAVISEDFSYFTCKFICVITMYCSYVVWWHWYYRGGMQDMKIMALIYLTSLTTNILTKASPPPIINSSKNK